MSTFIGDIFPKKYIGILKKKKKKYKNIGNKGGLPKYWISN